LNKLVSIKHW